MAIVLHDLQTRLPKSDRYTVTVGGSPITVSHTQEGDFINFSTDQSNIAVVVTYLKGNISSKTVGPKNKSVTSTPSGNQLSFNVSQGKYYVNINDPGALDDNQSDWVPLFIFVNPLEVSPPTGSTSDITYVGPGVHTVTGPNTITAGYHNPSTAYFDLQSGKTLYIHGEAVLRGRVRIGEEEDGGTGRTNATIKGRGVIDASVIPGKECGRPIRVQNSNNCTVDGVIALGARHWGVVARKSNNITFNNVKVFSWRRPIGGDIGGTPDGFDMVGSHTINITDFFSCSYDDGITIKAGAPGTTQGGPKSWVKNCYGIHYNGGLIYNRWAGNGMEIGYEVPKPIGDCSFKNITVYKRTRKDPVYRDAISIYAQDGGNVSNITYENIDVDWTTENYIGVISDGTSDVHSITFKNIVFHDQGPLDHPIMIGKGPGAKSEGSVANISFHDLKFNSGSTTVTAKNQIDIKEIGGTGEEIVTITTSGGSALPFTGNPMIDGYVQGNQELGSDPKFQESTLVVKNSTDTQYDRKTYLKFSIPANISSVTTAKVKLYVSSYDAPGPVPITLFPVFNHEAIKNDMIWPTAPGNGDALAGPVNINASGQYFEWTIPASFINARIADGSRKLSLLVYDSSVSDKTVTFHSLGGANPPQMVLS